MVIAGRGVTSISRLLSLVLPFTAGALLHALEGLCKQPHLPALALVGFALLQPSALSFGKHTNTFTILPICVSSSRQTLYTCSNRCCVGVSWSILVHMLLASVVSVQTDYNTKTQLATFPCQLIAIPTSN